MNDIKIDRNQLWTTTIFTVRNPLHGQIVEELKSQIYAHMQATGAGIHSGISTEIKSNLFESAFDFFSHDNSAVQTLKTDYGTRYLEATSRICVPPEDGMLVIFPSYLFHSGTLYRGSKVQRFG